MSKDRIAIIFILIFGFFFAVISLRYPLGTLNSPGEGFVPLLVSVILLILGFTNLMISIAKGHANTETNNKIHSSNHGFLILGATFLFAITVNFLGFILAATGMLYITLKVFQFKTPKIQLVMALVISVGSYFFFVKGLGLLLPKGILGFM